MAARRRASQFSDEVMYTFAWAYWVGFLVVVLVMFGRAEGGLPFFFLLIAFGFALAAFVPTAMAYGLTFYAVFSIVRRVLPLMLTIILSAALSGWAAMLFAQFVNIDIWPPRISLDENAVPDWPIFRWVAAISSAVMATLLRPGFELYAHD